MESLLQPIHVILILAIVIIIFGPGKLPDLGKGLERGISHLHGHRSQLRGALFMAQGVDPQIGRDVGEMLPDEHWTLSRILSTLLIAFLVGNVIYFLVSPFLPATARMGSGASRGLPALTDLWICVMVFGCLNLFIRLHRSHKSK
jgi:TatA/E family protein of Tat protein translocase